jgi:predicted DCC family thiol-disulfide oxidoreductase YuxK
VIVVFDGECLLCSRAVQFLLTHDHKQVLQFATIQSTAGVALVELAGLKVDRLETMLLFDEGTLKKDTAALFRIFHQLGWPWRLAWVAWIVPSPVRNAAYRFVARHRNRLFGRRRRCFVPAPEDKGRFIEQ